MQYYHLAALGHIIGGGFHSLSECLSISDILLKYESQSYQNLVPADLHTDFQSFFTFADKHHPDNLWVTPKLIEETLQTNSKPVGPS